MIDYREDISETPKWQHDCDSCVFIGGMSGVGTYLDFYICPDSSVVARYGNAGCEYHSGASFILNPRKLRVTECAHTGVYITKSDPNRSTSWTEMGRIVIAQWAIKQMSLISK